MKWADIEGLDALKKTLHSSIRNKHAAHAQLFISPEGGAGLACALTYATALHCTQPTEDDACGTCIACLQSKKFVHPDTHFYFPFFKKDSEKETQISDFLADFRAFIGQQPYVSLNQWSEKLQVENKQFTIPVATVRQLIQEAALKPYQSRCKVFVLWLPEFMNINASNALLKLLEEPPLGTFFLLVTKDADQLLPTIISRCQLVKVPPFSEGDIEAFLTKKYPDVKEEQKKEIAKAAAGNMLHAIYLLENNHELHTDLFLEWMRICYKKDPEGMMQLTERFSKMGKESLKTILSDACGILRDAIMIRSNAPELVRRNASDAQKITAFSKYVSENQLADFYKSINEALLHLERNANARIVLFDLSLQLSQIFRSL